MESLYPHPPASKRFTPEPHDWGTEPFYMTHIESEHGLGSSGGPIAPGREEQLLGPAALPTASVP